MFNRKKFDYDLIILGSGAGSSVGAHYGASLGKKVAIFEKAEIGGECPNWACVPTKAMLYCAKVYETVKNSKAYGTDAENIKFDFAAMKKWKDLVVSRTGAAHGEESFHEDNIDLIKEKARFINAHEVEAGGKIYSAKYFLIATGSSSFVPPITGLKEVGYVTFKEALDLPQIPKSIFILGGGAVGCEFAQIFSTLGSKVTIADSLDKLLFREDQEVSNLVQALFENRGIEVLTGINVSKVEKKGEKNTIYYQKGDYHHTLDTEQILVSTGKKPVLDFDPDKAGVKIEEGKLNINKHLQTNVSHIFAAGDVIGPYLFTHTGYYQSYVATNNMFSHNKIKADYSVVPRCVFIDPEVTSVGITEVQAKEKGIKTKKGIAALAILGRANTSNEFDGFFKVITDNKETIIGAAIVAPHAGEIIHELALAIKLKVKAKVLADMMHAYPTFSEGIKIACSSLE